MYKNYAIIFGTANGYVHQFIRVMKLTTFLLLISLMQLSAASFGQNLTLKEKNISYSKLFFELRKQTGYGVLIKSTEFKASKRLDVDFNNAPVGEVMRSVIGGDKLDYVITNKTIVIREKSVMDKIVDYFVNIDVTGKVVDENGQPIAGANVRVKGGSLATSTNGEGVFVLRNVEENAVLEVSYLGYQVREVRAKSQLVIISLEQAVGNLNEVNINAGYYSVKQREMTGNISKITAAKIEQQPVNNPLMALQGRVAGLEITQQTGTPGGGFTVRIRGRNSLSSGNDPMYIVDGVVYPTQNFSNEGNATTYGPATGSKSPSSLAFINPNDIESIEVLKDADATAIYGSRGANGVILITTKKGRIGTMSVSTAVSKGYSQVGHFVNLLNTEEYLMMRNEAFRNDGISIGALDYDVNGTWDKDRYTDWQKVLIGRSAPLTNASLNFTGGGENSNYALGGNYYSEGTVFPGDLGMQRVSFHSSTSLSSKDKRFNVSFSGNYSHVKSNLLSTDPTPSILLAPNAPSIYDQYGGVNWADNTFGSNPLAIFLRTSKSLTNTLIASTSLSYKIANPLELKLPLSYTKISRNELAKTPLASFSPASGVTATNRSSKFSNADNDTFLIEPQLNFNTKFGGNKFDALLGISFQDAKYDIDGIRASGYTNDDLMESLAGGSLIQNDGTTSFQYRYVSIFSRLNYSLLGKYFINLTARKDGSSRFGPGKQFANFGALGAAWIFSDEDFLKLPFLSFGKLRGSYGITGNDQIQNYGYLALWNSATLPYQGIPVLNNTSVVNSDFAWEINRKLEAALQLGFLKDKINLNVSWYRNLSSNQLLNRNLPLSVGRNSIYMNLPAEVQNTGWEFEANIDVLKEKAFRWSTGANFTLAKNRLLSYPDLEKTTADKNLYTIGQPLSIIKAYNVNVNSQTGLYHLEDRNANGMIDDADRYLNVFLGPKYYGGIQNSFQYKNLTLDFLISFVKQDGRSYISSTLNPGFWRNGGPNNQPTVVLNSWKTAGNEVQTARFSTVSANNSNFITIAQSGNISFVDASYIRFKNISLSYKLPENLLYRLKISNASINLQGQNIFTFTNYIGLDPETQSLATLPPLRTLTIGLNITL